MHAEHLAVNALGFENSGKCRFRKGEEYFQVCGRTADKGRRNGFILYDNTLSQLIYMHVYTYNLLIWRIYLRKTSNNNYIYRTDDKVSFGYFDEDGNLILETFDYKNDKITMEKYVVEK